VSGTGGRGREDSLERRRKGELHMVSWGGEVQRKRRGAEEQKCSVQRCRLLGRRCRRRCGGGGGRGTVFSGPNWVAFGIFLFFIIIVRLSFYRLYVTPTTYL